MKLLVRVTAFLGIVCLSASTITSCGSSTSSYSADKPSAIMSAVAKSISTVGSGLSGSVRSSRAARLSSTDCTVHGEPVSITDRSDAHYPGVLAYCKMTTDTGDEESVQGVFTGVAAIACMVEHASPTYDGAAHDLTLTFDTNCFTTDKLANMGIAAGTTVTASVTASAPAAFNSHFDRGVDITANVGGNHHYTFGTKVAGNVIEIAYFDEDKDQAHKTGSGAGYLDLSTGILRVESRMVSRLTVATAPLSHMNDGTWS